LVKWECSKEVGAGRAKDIAKKVSVFIGIRRSS
jgi:hypothetical protein